MASKKYELRGPAANDTTLGIPTGLFWLGLAGAVVLAVVTSSPAEASGDPNEGRLPAPPTGPTAPPKNPPGSTPVPPAVRAALPARTAVVQSPAGKARVHVYVKDALGEGIFERLRTNSGPLDGHGLGRIATLDNGEFAGFATGRTWVPAGGTNADAWMQLIWQDADSKVLYNYWIEQANTVQFHSPGATTHEGWGIGKPTTIGTRRAIYEYFATRYRF